MSWFKRPRQEINTAIRCGIARARTNAQAETDPLLRRAERLGVDLAAIEIAQELHAAGYTVEAHRLLDCLKVTP